MESLNHNQRFDFLARLLVTAVFINAIPNKITNFTDQVAFISSKGIPQEVSILLLISAILLLTSGSFLILFAKYQKLGSLLLVTFLLSATIIFHLFPFQAQYVFMNMSLIGGLLMIYNR